MDSSDRILVVGATGHLGRELVRQLRAGGRPVRALTRDPERAGPLEDFGAEVVRGDLLDPASLEPALVGVDLVVASAHGLLGKGPNNPVTVDRLGNRSLIDLAKRKGIRHFVYVSAMGIGREHPMEFFRIKYETEQYLESSGISHTIVRAAAFMETVNTIIGDRFLQSGKIMIFGDGTAKANAVSVRDVARFVILALDDERLKNRLIEVGGPEDFSAHDYAAVYAKITGRAVKKVRVPLTMLEILRPIVGLFIPWAGRILSMSLTAANPKFSFSCDMGPLLEEFPGEMTRFDDVASDWYATKGGAETS